MENGLRRAIEECRARHPNYTDEQIAREVFRSRGTCFLTIHETMGRMQLDNLLKEREHAASTQKQ